MCEQPAGKKLLCLKKYDQFNKHLRHASYILFSLIQHAAQIINIDVFANLNLSKNEYSLCIG